MIMVQSIRNTKALHRANQNLLQANSCSSEHSKLCFLKYKIGFLPVEYQDFKKRK